MNNLEMVKKELYNKKASLVVLYANGELKAYYQNRINDIRAILNEDKEALRGAIIADKVIGKVASSILTIAGVKQIYADVISKYAIPVLEENNIEYEYKKLVEYIQNNDKTGMCPMENKFKDEHDIMKIYTQMLG